MPNDVTIRRITGPSELALFSRLPYVLNDELAGDLDAGRRRPEWTWVALRGDHLLARAAWWGRAGEPTPMFLDIFDLDDDLDDDGAAGGLADAGLRLLRAAMAEVVPAGAKPPDYLRFLSPDWRETEAGRRPVERRMAILEQTGARFFVERLGLTWQAGTPVPAPSGRLAFRPVAGAEELIGLMTRVLDGTLDAYSRADLTRMTAREAAVEQYEGELVRYPSPREWWRVATLPDGEPVGFVIPARNDYGAIIAYLAVVPEQRGNGYIDDILAEGTRLLAAQDVPRIRADTDVGNVPMARSFARIGYITHQRRIDMTWS